MYSPTYGVDSVCVEVFAFACLKQILRNNSNAKQKQSETDC